MSRHGYSDDNDDQWALIRYRGQVASAIRGKRGQRALLDLIHGMDAMPEHRLAKDTFGSDCGVCALGVLANSRQVDISDLEPYKDKFGVDEVDSYRLSKRLDISECMVSEVMFLNDEEYENDDWGQWMRWQSMRAWARSKLSPEQREQVPEYEPEGFRGTGKYPESRADPESLSRGVRVRYYPEKGSDQFKRAVVRYKHRPWQEDGYDYTVGLQLFDETQVFGVSLAQVELDEPEPND